MRNLKIILIVGIVVILGIALFFFFGRGMYEETPNLHQSKWKSISVEYLVAEEKNLASINQEGEMLARGEIEQAEKIRLVREKEKQIWSTNDQAVLNQLQSSFRIIGGGDLWGYSESIINKIQLKLKNGREYVIHITSKDRLILNDYEHLKTGFGLDVSPDFQNTLKTMIESTKKEPVYFY